MEDTTLVFVEIDTKNISDCPASSELVEVAKAAAVVSTWRGRLRMAAERLAEVSAIHRTAESAVVEAEKAYAVALGAIRSSK